jgi:hypothetical protein
MASRVYLDSWVTLAWEADRIADAVQGVRFMVGSFLAETLIRISPDVKGVRPARRGCRR